MFILTGRWSLESFLGSSCAGLLLLAASTTAPALAQEPAEPGVLTLGAAVELALAHSPALAALDAQADALDLVPSQVGALPDPVLSLNALNMPTDTFDLDQEAMTQMQVALSQEIPFPGKRTLMRAAARHEARASQGRAAEERDVLTGAVRDAWWRLFSVDRSLEIIAQNQDLMRDFVEIAQTKYAVGKGLQQDVLLAQLELSRLLDRQIRLQGRRRTTEAELNRLIDRPPNRAVLLARTPPNVRLPELPTQAELLRRALESRELLAVHRDLLEAAGARVALAKRDRYPDFRVGAGYGFRQGDDPLRGAERADLLSVMLSVNVPLYSGSKQSKAIGQRTSERVQRGHSLNDALRSVEAEIARSLADYEAAQEQVLLLDTAIIPQAQQTVASMLAGYQVNEVDFLNVVNGQLTLYNSQINYWDALGKAKSALATLAAAVGTETLYE